MKHFYFLLMSLLLGNALLAQTGTVAGKVVEDRTNGIMTGVTVSVLNTSYIKPTDVEGRYVFNLPAGTYDLKFESVGFAPKMISQVVVKGGQTVELNVVLEQEIKEIEAVIVTSSVRRETVSSVLALQKNNASISDGISAESIKRSPDKNIGEVLKRVSGTSIQDDKFVIVRGLSDRYNVALINGALLPSTEPDRRAFSFDVVPSNLIDNILINKTASPDLPGDFSGGIVQILTKDIPFQNFMSIAAGVSYNNISTGKDFNIGILEPTDYLGFDNGKRLFPQKFPGRNRFASYNLDPTPERRLIASRLMNNNYGSRYNQKALPNMNFQFNYGNRKEMKNGATLGSVFALVYRNSQNIQYNNRRDYQTPDQISLTPGNLFFDYNDTTYSFNTNISLLANLAYKKGNNKFVFKNIANRLFENSNLVRSGYNYDNRQFINVSGSVPIIKSVISSQIEGEHLISERNDRLKWNINYALTARNQPDYRVLPYAKNLDDMDKDVAFNVVLRDTYRFWSDLFENAFGANLNYSLPLDLLNQKQLLKTGFFSQYKLREFDTRIFRYEQASSVLNPLLSSLPPRRIFNDGNIYEQGFVLNEITNNTDRYDATSGLYAGYAMIDGRFGEKLRAVYGVRIESFDFIVNTANFSGEKVEVNKSYIDILPSINLTYQLSNKTNLRFSGSQTVSRPEFREVANFAYYDFVRNAQLKGNVNLERSQNTNLDLRFETYPSAGEIFSASIFYKHFRKPIEQTVDPGSTPSNLILSYTNPDAARTFGAELEIRKDLAFLGSSPLLENLSFNLNAAIMQSQVDFNENSNPFDNKRPLQGQSPWLINAGIQYTVPNNNVSLSALVNRIGHRISAVGFQGYPDIYENGRTILDFQAAVKILRAKGELKLNLSDMLNQRAIFYQNVDLNDKQSYNASKDRIQYNYLYGRSFSLGFAYNFN